MKAELRNEVLHIPGLTNHLGASVRARVRGGIQGRRYRVFDFLRTQKLLTPLTSSLPSIAAKRERERERERERGRGRGREREGGREGQSNFRIIVAVSRDRNHASLRETT